MVGLWSLGLSIQRLAREHVSTAWVQDLWGRLFHQWLVPFAKRARALIIRHCGILSLDLRDPVLRQWSHSGRPSPFSHQRMNDAQSLVGGSIPKIASVLLRQALVWFIPKSKPHAGKLPA